MMTTTNNKISYFVLISFGNPPIGSKLKVDKTKWVISSYLNVAENSNFLNSKANTFMMSNLNSM